MRRLGVDPGSRTGIAVWDEERECLLALRTVPQDQAEGAILTEMKSHGVGIVIIERPDPDTVTYQRPGCSPAAMRKISRNVGMNIGFSDHLARVLEPKVKTVQVAPARRGTKLDRRTWEAMGFRWEGKCSEHARDAAVIARWGFSGKSA